MSRSLDSQFTPHLDEEQLTALQKPSRPVVADTTVVKSERLPPTDPRSVHDAILQSATRRYGKLLRSVAYPYGTDPYTERPLDARGNPLGDSPRKAPKGVRNMLWKHAYKKAYKKATGSGPGKAQRIHRPKHLKLKGGALYTFGTGIEARGTCARGGSITATLLGLAAPLIIKGVAALVPHVIKAIKKRRAKGRGAKQGEPEPGPGTAQDIAAAKGAGDTPTPYQAERAKAEADANAAAGRVGYPNPLSYPEYPPSLMDPNVPIDALTFWREVYNKVKQGMMTTAEATRLPPKYALPYVHKFIKAHARKTFGRGGARILLGSNIRGKPMKTITPFKLIYPVLEHSVSTPQQREKLYRSLKRGTMKKAVTGEGLGDILESLASFIGHGAISPKYIFPVVGAAARHVGAYIIDALQAVLHPLFADNGASVMDRISSFIASMVGHNDDLDIGTEMMPLTGTGISARGSAKKGATIVATGQGIWDVLKTILLIAGEVGAPLVGAAASDRLGSSKATKRALETAGNVASEVIGDMRTIVQLQDAQKDALKELEKKKEELEKAAALTPELYKQLKREAEMGKMLADQLKTQQGLKGFDVADEFAPMKKWNMVPDEFGKLRRSYLTAPDLGAALAKHKKKAAALYKGTDEMMKYKTGKAKESKKLKKMEKALKKIELEEKLDAATTRSPLARATVESLQSKARRKARTKKYMAKYGESKPKAKQRALAKEKSYYATEASETRPYVSTDDAEMLARYRALRPSKPSTSHTALEEDVREPVFAEGTEKYIFSKGRGASNLGLKTRRFSTAEPMQQVRLKPVKGLFMSVGPTSDAAVRSRMKAGQVMMLAKKMG